MRRLFLTTLILLATLTASATGRAKYVFYFIGDGMGVNQVNATETYLAALDGRIGVSPILFGTFPYVGIINTQSATNGVTDSAAAGTALATGHKAKNGALGVLADGTTPIWSVAQWAKDAGAAVGVTTSVSLDHATPAAFYAHVGGRGSYYQIGKDVVRSDYDFYAGSDFLQPVGEGEAAAEGSLYEQCERAGYTIARGYADFRSKCRKNRKMILLQTEEASARERNSLPYAIDRTPADMTLSQITSAAIEALTAQQDKDGFFLMVEGGKIDWACHTNDVATVIREVQDMDDAVAVAYRFYQQHPDETLIVVTADHETGGIVLGRGPYELHLDRLQYQRMSTEQYSAHLTELQQSKDSLTWENVKADLEENWGFWKHIELTDHQSDRLRRAYNDHIAGKDKSEESLYASLGGIASAARRTMAEAALVGWVSGGHSNGYVPIFAIGAGADQFAGKYDNTEIPKRISQVAGWPMR